MLKTGYDLTKQEIIEKYSKLTGRRGLGEEFQSWVLSLTGNLDNKKILRYYILPNLYPPVIIILGLSLPGIIGGSVILESIFSIDGMGLLFYQSALSHDYPVIMGILIIGAFLTLLGNLLADLVLLKLNPNYNDN